MRSQVHIDKHKIKSWTNETSFHHSPALLAEYVPGIASLNYSSFFIHEN